MLDAEAFARSEGLSTKWNPIVKQFKAEGKNFKCSFTPGINYFVSNEKTRELGVPARMEGGKLWVPADDMLTAFETALDRRYTADTVSLTVTGVNAPAAKKASAGQSSSAAARTNSSSAMKPASSAAEKSSSSKAKARVHANDRNEPVGTREVRTIVIDPGHGGKDPGAIGKISQEKDVALAVGKKLKKALTEEGFDVKLTRETDVFIELGERPNLANKWDGDLFISLHCNAVDGPRKDKTEGYRVYVLRDPESEEDKAIARRENKVITEYGENSKAEISPLEWFKIEARLEKYKQNSYVFTEKVLDRFEGGKVKKLASGAGGAGFMVLVNVFMPAVLVEMGFISNPDDEKYLNTEQGQKDIAERIAKAASDYRDSVDEYRRTLDRP